MTTINTISKMELLNALQGLGIGIILVNPNLPNYPIVYVNEKFEHMTGYHHDDVYDKEIIDFFGKQNEQEVRKLIKNVNGELQPLRTDLSYYQKNGQSIWFSVLVMLVHSDEYDHPLHLWLIEDRTYTKSLQIQMEGRNQLVKMIYKSYPLHEILAEFCLTIEKIIPNSKAAIAIVQPIKNQISSVVSPNLPKKIIQRLKGIDVENQDFIFYECLQKKKPIITERILLEPRWLSFYDDFHQHNFQSCWTIPLFLNSGKKLAIGILLIFTHPCKKPTLLDYQLIFGVAQSIAIAFMTNDAKEQLDFKMHYDELTGLPNHYLFKEQVQNALRFAKKTNHRLAVLMLDVNRFRLINDTFGHSRGDYLLKEMADRLKRYVRTGAIVARFSGDKFTVLIPNLFSNQDAKQAAEEILEAFEQPFEIEGNDIYLVPSVGISIFPDDADDYDSLVKNADIAVNRAKENVNGNYQFFLPQFVTSKMHQLAIESSLKKAIEHDELLLYYQPQYYFKNDEFIAVEALLRWNHPEFGVLSPGQFITIAEEMGIIVDIGKWVLKTACMQVKQWQETYHCKIKGCVNLSIVQFLQEDLVALVRETLEETKLDPECLELEITESLAMQDMDNVICKLQSLKELGLHIAIDDFGTGYSSLNYLTQLPLHTLKIDKSFIDRDFKKDKKSRSVTEAIIALAHSLDLTVVAEGVETEEQYHVLKKQNCDIVQGYLLSKPLPTHEVESIIKTKTLLL